MALAAQKAAQALWKLSFSTEAIEWLGKGDQSRSKSDRSLRDDGGVPSPTLQLFSGDARMLESAKRVNPKSAEVFRGFATVELKRGNPVGRARLW